MSTYTGSSTYRLTKRFNQNQLDFGTTPAIQLTPYPQFQAGILTSDNDGNANFEGISLRKVFKAMPGGTW